jgi:hypothetical protein
LNENQIAYTELAEILKKIKYNREIRGKNQTIEEFIRLLRLRKDVLIEIEKEKALPNLKDVYSSYFI